MEVNAMCSVIWLQGTGKQCSSHGNPIAINRTYDIWHDFLHDMWYNIWHDIQDYIWNNTWQVIWYDIQQDICWFFFVCVFNDIKSNTTSDRLSVLTSNRTIYVTSGHLNVIWYDIQQDIFLLCVQQVSGHSVKLILEIHIRCHVRCHMKLHLTWHLIWHSTGHIYIFFLRGVQFHFWFLVILSDLI